MLEEHRKSKERPATPKVFYQLPKRDTVLTLELDYKGIYSSKTDNDAGDDASVDDVDDDDDNDVEVRNDKSTKKVNRTYSSESVSAWMRRSSGVISDDHLRLFHAKLLNDTVKLCSSTSDVHLTSKESGLGKRSFSVYAGLGAAASLSSFKSA